MGKKIDLAGKRFGRLCVISMAAKRSKTGRIQWNCLCDCGTSCVISGYYLLRGSTSSCGCLQSEKSREKLRKLNTTHGMWNAPGYDIWNAMISRCNNPNNKRYCDYGGRGIRVCERWLNVKNFLADIGEKPTDLTLDRIDNNKGYSPDNCRWATPSEQSRNQRLRKDNKTGIRGVGWNKATKKYIAHIRVNYKFKYLGLFPSISKAIEARRQAEIKYWGKEMNV